jgi:hypothetical protein
MKKITGVLLWAALGLVPAVVSAAEIKGVLLDQACASGDGLKDGQKGALKHDRDCALMEACAKSGYGIVTADDKFLKFDSAGNEKALALLKKTTKADDLRVKVTGDVTGDQITVASITLE